MGEFRTWTDKKEVIAQELIRHKSGVMLTDVMGISSQPT